MQIFDDLSKISEFQLFSLSLIFQGKKTIYYPFLVDQKSYIFPKLPYGVNVKNITAVIIRICYQNVHHSKCVVPVEFTPAKT